MFLLFFFFFFFSSRRRHTRCYRDWSSDVCSSDLALRSDNVADAFSFDLLRGRPLLMDIITQAAAEGGVDLLHAAGIDHFDLAPVGVVQVDGVLEHGQWLCAMICEQ